MIGVILVFVMLTQYNTWILIGVMEEKSSRVVEVLLATRAPDAAPRGQGPRDRPRRARPGQRSSSPSRSCLGRGGRLQPAPRAAPPIEVASALLWLVLGYAFYCWVYAAAASMAERQDQVQSLALPAQPPDPPRLRRCRSPRPRTGNALDASSRSSPTSRRPRRSRCRCSSGSTRSRGGSSARSALISVVCTVRRRAARRGRLPPGDPAHGREGAAPRRPAPDRLTGHGPRPHHPTTPSASSRSRSACPLCRAYSSIMCT